MPARIEAEIKMKTLPLAIIGSGPVGLLAALSLAPIYDKILLIGPQPNREDGRTSALMMPAINQLDQLGVWEKLEAETASLRALRLIDATQRLIRAPTVTFRATEIGEAAFGYNIPNKILNKILHDKVKTTANIFERPHAVSHYQHEDDSVTISLEDGTQHKVAIIIAADGRNSPAREAAGIKARHWHYPQKALVLNFTHQQPHQNISTEFHTRYGPFTQVPLPGNRSSLVWVLSPSQADRLSGLGRHALEVEIEKNMGSMLGKVTLDEASQDWPPQSWPLGGVILSHFAAKRTFLVGEAAHVFPPIGAQGLNLGLRDIADLTYLMRNHAQTFDEPRLIQEYNHRRRPDIWGRTGLVHALNRTLLSNFLIPQILRSGTLEALRQLPPLRSWFMREGLTPGSGLRSLLSPLTLPLS